MGVLKRFSRRASESEGVKSSSNLCMVALRSSEAPDLSALARRIASELESASFDVSPDSGQGAEVISIPGGSLGLGLMKMPIPWGDLEWPVSTAWAWPEAREELSAHQSHIVMFVGSSTMSSIAVSLVLTQAVSVVLAETDAAGVYYGNAAIVISAEQYSALAREASESDLPLFLWLGFHPVRDEKGLSGYTTGMKALGFLELEVRDSALEPSDLMEFLANVAHYELSSGLQIGNGETVGASESERFDVAHEASRFGGNEICCLINLL